MSLLDYSQETLTAWYEERKWGSSEALDAFAARRSALAYNLANKR